MRRHAEIVFWIIIPIVSVCFRASDAQTVVSARASITLTVVSGISAESSGALNLGRLAGETGPLTLRQKSSQVMDLKVSGPPAGTVWITFPFKTTLSNAEGDLVSFTPEIGWRAPNTRSAGVSTALETPQGNAYISSHGPLFIEFGGSINPENVEEGSYRGIYTITVVY